MEFNLKLHDKILAAVFVISLIVVVIFDVIAKDSKELFYAGDEVASILVNLALSCAAGCIIYYISSYIPIQQEERKQIADQLKIDEITSIRLKKILDSFARILITAHNDISKFQEVMATPISKEKFTTNNFKIKSSDIAIFNTPSKISHVVPIPSMTIAEFIAEEINNIKEEVEKTLGLGRYISAELINTLSDLENVPVINNWHVLIDNKPILLNGVEYISSENPISEYYIYFKELDNAYKKLQQFMREYSHTHVGKQYCDEFDDFLKSYTSAAIT